MTGEGWDSRVQEGQMAVAGSGEAGGGWLGRRTR